MGLVVSQLGLVRACVRKLCSLSERIASLVSRCPGYKRGSALRPHNWMARLRRQLYRVIGFVRSYLVPLIDAYGICGVTECG